MNDLMKRYIAALLLGALLMPGAALAAEYDAQTMEAWLSRFCEALASLDMLGDPAQTADPARPGEYLQEYAFGTVTATTAQHPQPEQIVEIDVRTQQVTDCLGLRVGASLDEATGGRSVGRSNTQLYVLATQDAGLGFSWAYLSDAGVYGVEYITYGGADAAMKEYTLTYVIGEESVSAIRIRCAATTQAQAEQAMRTAEEIAQRQRGEVYAVKNAARALEAQELQVMGVRALGTQAADLVAALGEPVEIQALSGGAGRLLLYEGAAIELGLNEQTGEEIVRGVSVSGTGVLGPRGLAAGMSVQEAASLFRCDEDVYAVGGVLYMEGEAADEPPYAELVQGEISGEATLRYIAAYGANGRVCLEIGVRDGVVTYWHFFDDREEAYGGI